MLLRPVVLLLAAVLVACGGDSPTSPGGGGGGGPTFENIAGNYTGVLVGVSQGVTLNGTFSVTVVQSGGSLSGTTAVAGTLSDASGTFPFQGTGSYTGSIGSGQNPSVNTTSTDDTCPNIQSSFSGSYDSTNRVITLNGPFIIFDASNCTVLLTFNLVLILTR